MYIIRQLPFSETSSAVRVAGEDVAVRSYQIVVWLSISAGETLPADALMFPAVMDTGHNHNFSIQKHQLTAWANVRADQLPRVGNILVNRQQVPLSAAFLWLHRNQPGTSELLPRPYLIAAPKGIAVYPDSAANAPRLPLLGLRALVTNGLQLVIDGERLTVSLRKPRRIRTSNRQ